MYEQKNVPLLTCYYGFWLVFITIYKLRGLTKGKYHY